MGDRSESLRLGEVRRGVRHAGAGRGGRLRVGESGFGSAEKATIERRQPAVEGRRLSSRVATPIRPPSERAGLGMDRKGPRGRLDSPWGGDPGAVLG
jgi:hypothetical protein